MGISEKSAKSIKKGDVVMFEGNWRVVQNAKVQPLANNFICLELETDDDYVWHYMAPSAGILVKED